MKRLTDLDYRCMQAVDPRVALGAKPLRPGQPPEPCAHCLPALIAADTYDETGRASCLYCMARPERRKPRVAQWADTALVMLEDAA